MTDLLTLKYEVHPLALVICGLEGLSRHGEILKSYVQLLYSDVDDVPTPHLVGHRTHSSLNVCYNQTIRAKTVHRDFKFDESLTNLGEFLH